VRRSAEGLKIRLSTENAAKLEIDAGRGEPIRVEVTRAQFEDLIRADIERTIESCRKALADSETTPAEIDEVVLVGGSTRIPLVRRRIAEFFGRDPHTEIDPDLAVALGAAVQADVLGGRSRSLLLLDVIPLSLGIETMGGAFSKLILRNATIPCSATEEFSTQVDNQTGVDVNIYQGERELVKDCRLLGAFKLRGIPPMPAGLPRVQVTFLVNADGVLTVSAKELRSGQSASIEVVPSFGLTKDEVHKIVAESIEHAQDDLVARELLEIRNKARAMLKGTETALAKAGDGLPPEQTFTIRRAMKAVAALVDGDDYPRLKAAVDELSGATAQVADDLIGAAVKRALMEEGR
jgi:molecular chaperone DnaK (HSP70)